MSSQFIDLHHHLDTLSPLFNARNRLQEHLIHLQDYNIKNQKKSIISLAFYVPFYNSYNDLLSLIKNMVLKIKSQNIKIIETQDDLKDNFSLGIIFHIESARILTDFNSQLPELFDLGIRGIIPIHFKDNQLGNSCDDLLRRTNIKKRDDGLTTKGLEFVSKCNELGLWLDIAHATDITANDILDTANNTIISHVGVRNLHPFKRNQSLSLLKKLADKGGVIGITPWQRLIGNKKESYKEQFEFLIKNNLKDSICIGSDFGAPIKTYKDFKSSFNLAEVLNSFEHAHKFQWENAYNFFKRVLPKK